MGSPSVNRSGPSGAQPPLPPSPPADFLSTTRNPLVQSEELAPPPALKPSFLAGGSGLEHTEDVVRAGAGAAPGEEEEEGRVEAGGGWSLNQSLGRLGSFSHPWLRLGDGEDSRPSEVRAAGAAGVSVALAAVVMGLLVLALLWAGGPERHQLVSEVGRHAGGVEGGWVSRVGALRLWRELSGEGGSLDEELPEKELEAWAATDEVTTQLLLASILEGGNTTELVETGGSEHVLTWREMTEIEDMWSQDEATLVGHMGGDFEESEHSDQSGRGRMLAAWGGGDKILALYAQSWGRYHRARLLSRQRGRSAGRCRAELNLIAGGNFADQITKSRYAYQKNKDKKKAIQLATVALQAGMSCFTMAKRMHKVKLFRLVREGNRALAQLIQALGGGFTNTVDTPTGPKPRPKPVPKPSGGGGVTPMPDFHVDYCKEHINNMDQDWGNGNDITIRFDRSCGSRWRTRNHFCEGAISADIKLSSGNLNGQVISFYTSSLEGGPCRCQDEIDFEWLGKDPTVVQTNFYCKGKGGREQKHNLGFDARSGFHNYKIDISPERIIWYVDGRQVRRDDATAYPECFPKKCWYLYSSVWDASFVAGGSWSGINTWPQGDKPYYHQYKNVMVPMKKAGGCPVMDFDYGCCPGTAKPMCEMR